MPATPQTPDITDALRAIRALSDLHGTHSSLDESHALDALQARRPAYWTTASYHNQLACVLLGEANRRGASVALDQWSAIEHPSYAASRPYLLGTLIPLNSAARAEINREWAEIGETMSLIRRARAARPAPMFQQAAE